MATPMSPHADAEQGFTLGDMFGFLWQSKFRIVFIAAIIMGLGGYHVVNMPKVYEASGTLLLSSDSSRMSLNSALSSVTGNDTGAMDTYMEFIRSRTFVESMIADLNLMDYGEYQHPSNLASFSESKDYAVRRFQANLTLEPVGDTDLLRLSFLSNTPELAADVLNFLGPAFFTYHTGMRKQRADDASRWLNVQLGNLQAKLEEAESQMQDFMRDNRLIDVASQIELAQTEVASLLHEKLQNDKALAAIEATVQQVDKANGDVDALMKIPYILKNSLVISMRTKLLEQEQALTEVAKRYKEKHHRYIAAKSTVDNLNDELASLLTNIIASLKQDLLTFQSRSQKLTQEIDSAKSQHSDLGRHELQLSRLRRKIDTTQQLYESFLTRLQEVEMLQDIGEEDDFAVVDMATIPTRPSKPNIPVLLAMVGLFSLTMSTGFWLVIHLISDSKSRHAQLLRSLDVPILTELPKLSKVKTPKDMSEAGSKNFVFSEAIRFLRASLMVANKEKDNRIIAITGIRQGDGKTSVSMSIAHSFGRLERALLVDTDMREPSIGKAFDIDGKAKGLTDFVSKEAKFSDCQYRVKGSQLTVVPAGKQPADPMETISKPRFEAIIRKLGIFYDRVIIEAPSVNSYADTLVLAKYVDGIVLVCDANNTEMSELMEAVQRLRENEAPLLGVVFNKVKHVRSAVSERGKRRSLILRPLRQLRRFLSSRPNFG